MGLEDSFVIGTVVFVPLAILLYFVLNRYAYPYTKYTYFNGQKIMMSIAAGMILGLFISLAYRFFPPYYAWYAIFFAVIEELVRLVIFNSPWFQLKFDSIFYGAALGGGTATIIISSIAYTSLYGASSFWSASFLSTLIIFSVSILLLNISNGAMIGYGCGKGMGWSYSFRAIIYHILFNVSLIAVIYPDQSQVGIFYYPSLISLIVMAIFVYLYVYKNIILNALPDKLRRQYRRELLAIAREGNRPKTSQQASSKDDQETKKPK